MEMQQQLGNMKKSGKREKKFAHQTNSAEQMKWAVVGGTTTRSSIYLGEYSKYLPSRPLLPVYHDTYYIYGMY